MKAAIPEYGFWRKAWELQKYSRAQIFLWYLENNRNKQTEMDILSDEFLFQRLWTSKMMAEFLKVWATVWLRNSNVLFR